MLEIEPQGDHLIILRRFKEDCQLAMQFSPQLRKLSEAELIQKVKEVEDSYPFGDEKAYFKLYVSSMGYFFYFENPDS